MRNFFIWCAGSDQDILAHCTKAERNKHIGYGTLVLVPAILALVSMSFALSTIKEISDQPIFYLLGGLVWSLIIFSFDRFVVSTHRRKMSNREELNQPSFYLRFAFAFILGIVISHPLVMLYFDGSVQDQLARNTETEKERIGLEYDQKIMALSEQTAILDSSIWAKEAARNEQAQVVALEIDGEIMKAKKGNQLTTGLRGKGPSAERKIKQLDQLQKELDDEKAYQAKLRVEYQAQSDQLRESKEKALAAFSLSKDYLQREMALEQLKEEHSIVGLTQFLLISLFILVDILPVIFKTFAPFGMYDRILMDDGMAFRELDHASRIAYVQKAYEGVSEL